MITATGATTNRYDRPPNPSTLHRIRATLRSALNAAIREGLLRDNPARYVELPSPRHPHALVWTPQRVDAWKKTGERPSVAVWTVEQAATFLSFVTKDCLAVMWWLIALRGLRRGEAAGLRLGRRQSGCRGGDDRAAAHRQRPPGYRRASEDRGQPPADRPRPAHRTTAA
ncbi:hypothetical protein GCM10010434_075670 [Winogradskya humida]